MAYAQKTVSSPIGKLVLIANEEGLAAVLFDKDRKPRHIPSPVAKAARHPILDKAEKQLHEYFSGKRKDFDVPLVPTGTAFQRKVWKSLQSISFGKTLSYGGLAQKIRQPKAARAVGMANNRNPLPIIIPCHRVIGSSGKMVGYGGGLKVKAYLLKHEGLTVKA
jgi:methylated-DNA-[protein]-cysteine S-methyltransferase